MVYRVEFYQTLAGTIPTEEFLEYLRLSHPKEHKKTIANLIKLQDDRLHGEPLTKHLEDNLLEVRTGVQNPTRIFFCYGPGRSIQTLNGFLKKTARTPIHELTRARNLRDEFESRRIH